MYDNDIFNPGSTANKVPYGAVPAGSSVTFTLTPLREQGFSRGEITLRYEFDHDRTDVISMPWTDTDWVRDCFSCTVELEDYTGLIWYSFKLTGFRGREVELGEYQLTVYDSSEAVPDWFGQGMCYQILPDRFYRTEIPDPAGMVGGRWVHQGWEEDPAVGAMGKTPEGWDICNRDFFGGNLKGVEEKLPYLASLGVETIYFCPIFEAAENHRYGTADYHRIDPMLGMNEDFSHLCHTAHSMGIRILLDGVFNHTGWTSRYFNGDGYYGEHEGASRDWNSPYRPWFQFKNWPDDYESWWGIYSLPAVEEECQSYRDFIFGAEDSVVRRWLRAGADGWRLDVADELPDDFVAGLHAAVRAEKPDAAVIGEVWEDGTTKIAYGVRRRHLLGRHLDSLMNYPFRNALIAYLLGGDGAEFQAEMEPLRQNYPPFAFYGAMNSLGTHDTLRILTYLGTETQRQDWRKEDRGHYRMTPEERDRGLARLRLGAAVLFAFPGAPTVYYGDEAGMEGYEDPFNRRTFPWGQEDQALTAYFARLGNARKESQPLRRGELRWGTCQGSVISFARVLGKECAGVAVNRSGGSAVAALPWPGQGAEDALTGRRYLAVNGVLRVRVPAMSALLLKQIKL
jgi:cyclomaltodextrinase / maltogenic alpha-amylase / neopullulanase